MSNDSSFLSIWEFSCVSPMQQDLCFHNGSCGLVDGLNTCICPDGFTRDYEFLHFDNCVKRTTTTRDFTIFLGIIVFIIAMLYIFKIHRRLKNSARSLGIVSFISLFTLLSMLLSILFQDGCFEGCAVMGIVHFTILSYMCQKVLLLALTPVYAVQHKPIDRLQRFLVGWNIISCVSFWACGIAMLVACRGTSNLAKYNVATFAANATFWICAIVDMGAMIWSCEKLHRQIADMQRMLVPNALSARYIGLSKRLRFLQTTSGIIAVPYILLLIITPIIITIYGSFPYFFVIVYLEMIDGACFFSGALLLFVNPTDSLVRGSPGPQTPKADSVASILLDEMKLEEDKNAIASNNNTRNPESGSMIYNSSPHSGPI